MSKLDRDEVQSTAHAQRSWWVNQGKTYLRERDGGILWAPKVSGQGRCLVYWESMCEVAPGDMILHYAKGRVRALSYASAAALDARRPLDLPDEWDSDGRLVRTNYVEAEVPVLLAEIPVEWRSREPADGPFNRDLGVKQGYLFPLTQDFTRRFVEQFGSRYGDPSAAGENVTREE